MSGIESTGGTGRRWLVRPAVLLALITVLVLARTGRSTSNTTEDEAATSTTSELALHAPSPMTIDLPAMPVYEIAR